MALISPDRLVPADHDLQDGVDVVLQTGQPRLLQLELALDLQDGLGHVFKGRLGQAGDLLLLERHQLFGGLDRALLDVERLGLLRGEALLASKHFVNLQSGLLWLNGHHDITRNVG